MSISTNDVADILFQTRALMPATTTTELAVRFAQLFEKAIAKTGNVSLLQNWANVGLADFLNRCGITTTARPCVPYDMQVSETAIAEFCNRWLSIDKFRLADEDGELRPVSAEMHGLRMSMVAELQVLAGLTPDEVPQEVK